MSWCPHCKMEYREGIPRCPDCGGNLADAPAGEGEPDAAAKGRMDSPHFHMLMINYTLVAARDKELDDESAMALYRGYTAARKRELKALLRKGLLFLGLLLVILSFLLLEHLGHGIEFPQWLDDHPVLLLPVFFAVMYLLLRCVFHGAAAAMQWTAARAVRDNYPHCPIDGQTPAAGGRNFMDEKEIGCEKKDETIDETTDF